MHSISTCMALSKTHKHVVYMAVMEHLDRHSAHDDDDYKGILHAVIPLFDATLMLHFGRLSAKDFPWDKWLDGHKNLAGFVMARADIDVVLDVRDDPQSATTQLVRLCAPSQTGQAVFRLPRDQIGSRVLSSEFETQIEIVKAANFSPASLKHMMGVTDARIKQFHKGGATEKRIAKFTFFKMQVTRTIATLRPSVDCCCRLQPRRLLSACSTVPHPFLTIR